MYSAMVQTFRVLEERFFDILLFVDGIKTPILNWESSLYFTVINPRSRNTASLDPAFRYLYST